MPCPLPSLPSDYLGAQSVQPLIPEAAEAIKPHVRGAQWLGVQRIKTPSTLLPNRGEPGFSQDPQLPRDGWLGDAELLADDLGCDTCFRIAALPRWRSGWCRTWRTT